MQRVFSILLLTGMSAIAWARPTAFINVNVLPMTSDSLLNAQTVIVNDGLIAEIGDVDSIPVPEGAQVVDGTDRFLMPGLAEMHAHVTGGGTSLERTLTLFAANGVTTIRGMLGRQSHLALRQALLDGAVFGPRLITSGPSLNGNSVAGPADGRAKVRAQHAAGYDFIKIHPGLSAEEFAAIAGVAKELDMPVAGHVPASTELEGALAAGMATIDHLDGYFAAMMPADSDLTGGFGGFFGVMLADQLVEERIPELAARTAAAGTWNVPTEALFEHFVSDVSGAELSDRPEMQYVPRATVEQWVEAKEQLHGERGFSAEVAARAIEVRRQLIRSLHDAGAGLLLGSDAPQVFNVPGFSLHHELEFLVLAGLTPYEALRTGTVAVGDFFNAATGRVEAGAEADLVLLDANPLSDIRNTRRIHGVMLRGAWHSAADLERRLSQFRRD
jgi:imidazolonepropionase-like amidohydrolase